MEEAELELNKGQKSNMEDLNKVNLLRNSLIERNN